jgi:hypothetical protein
VGVETDAGVGALVSAGRGLKDGVLAALGTDFAATGRPAPAGLQASASTTNVAATTAESLFRIDIWLPPARTDALSGP